MPKRTKKTFEVAVKVVGAPPAVDAIAPVAPRPVASPAAKRPAEPKLPRSASTASHQRRVMWTLVAAAIIVVGGGWYALLSLQLSSHSDRSLSAAWEKVRSAFTTPFQHQKANAADAEIRQLDKQVFPELSK